MKLINIISISLLFLLSACGGGKIVTTSDDSADYSSARQLPPLSKNSQPKSEQTLDKPAPAAVTLSNQSITANIVDASNNAKRVLINAPIEQAWSYFLNQLRVSAVTIHSRNNKATRVEVGCGDINDGTDTVSRGGWSFINRENLIYEYCVMQLSESRGATLVTVHNRRGEEVNGSEAITLLNQLVSQ